MLLSHVSGVLALLFSVYLVVVHTHPTVSLLTAVVCLYCQPIVLTTVITRVWPLLFLSVSLQENGLEEFNNSSNESCLLHNLVSPQHCSRELSSCQFTLSWWDDTRDTIEFTLTARTSGTVENVWAAVGFSDDQMMVSWVLINLILSSFHLLPLCTFLSLG